MKSNNILVLNAVDASISQTSGPIPLGQIYGYAAQFVFSSSSSAGTISLNGSCDPLNPQAPISSQVPTNWTQIPSSSMTVSAGANGMWNINGAFYNWVEVVWMPSAGTGTLSVRMEIKGI